MCGGADRKAKFKAAVGFDVCTCMVLLPHEPTKHANPAQPFGHDFPTDLHLID